jgi:hypothetical protein
MLALKQPPCRVCSPPRSPFAKALRHGAFTPALLAPGASAPLPRAPATVAPEPAPAAEVAGLDPALASGRKGWGMETCAYPLEALVVLGCRVEPQGKASGALRRRLQRAAEAYRQGQAPLVVACGGRLWQGHAEAWVMRAHLIDEGVPAEALLVDLCSLNTLENALHAASLLGARGLRRVGVVTCDWHMHRALRLFRRVGLAPHPVPALSPPVPLPSRAYRSFREHFSGWLDALR